MYCIKCGKQIDSGNMCSDCSGADFTQAPPAYTQPPMGGYQYNNTAPTANTTPIVTPPPAVKTTPAQSTSAFAATTKLPDPNNAMYGFGKALASTIMSTFGFIFAYVFFAVTMVMGESGIFVSMIFVLPLIIVPMIFGISSIKVFNARKATCAKPIATLILGIVGLATSAIAALVELIFLLSSAAIFL